MNVRRDDPLELKYDADAVIERAADRLRAVLLEAVGRLNRSRRFRVRFSPTGSRLRRRAWSRQSGDAWCLAKTVSFTS